MWGLTAYGIALLSYYVDRSQDHILMHVSLPAVLAGACLARRCCCARARRCPARCASAGWSSALVGALVLSVAWSSIGARFPRTALAHAGSRRGVHARCAASPLASAGAQRPAPEGVQLLDRFMPGEPSSLVMVAPDLGTEILLRSDRVDELFLGDPGRRASSPTPAAGAPQGRRGSTPASAC